MLDPKLLRADIEAVASQLKRKAYDLDISRFSQLEEKRKSLQVETQELQSVRNQRSKEIGAAKGRGEDIGPIKSEMDQLSKNLKEKEQQLQSLQDELQSWMAEIPNLPDDSVPAGADEQDNEVVRLWG